MKNVKIYSTPMCQYCDIAKQYFKDNDITFEEIDVSNNEIALQEMLVLSDGMRIVPVIVIEGIAYVGFDKQLIKEALNT